MTPDKPGIDQNYFVTVSPESVGISSQSIHNFLDRIEERGVFLHSFLLMRHGKICAEGYWKPFHKDLPHRLYSVSKTFVSAAIGMLSDEGRLSLEDRIIKYFADKLPDAGLNPYIAKMTIRDLLIMATPYDRTTYRAEDSDWAWTFFNTQPTHPSGTIFKYDTSGTYVLGVIVERITGKPLLEYLKNKLLAPIGFSPEARCIKAPEGYSWGGSGVIATTRDLAKFALVFLNEGRFNGQQLISKEYVKAATAKQIITYPYSEGIFRNEGYGYQVWVHDDGSYSFRGMGSQHAICVPHKDLIFVCTGDTQGSSIAYRIIYQSLWQEILGNTGEPLPENGPLLETLQTRLANLECLPFDGKPDSSLLSKINDVTFVLNDNPMKIDSFSINITGKEGAFQYSTPRGKKTVKFGIGYYLQSDFPETHYFGDTIGKPSGRMYKAMSCGLWIEEHKLMIRTYIIDDYFGNLTTTISFKGEQVSIYMHKNAEWFLDEYHGTAGGVKRNS